MEVILREDIDRLGSRGDVVKVAPGYARNFLLPKKLAVAATESNKKIVEQERQALARLKEITNEAFVTASIDLNPEIMEYERTSTTVMNAVLGPRCGQYGRTVEQRVRDRLRDVLRPQTAAEDQRGRVTGVTRRILSCPG